MRTAPVVRIAITACAAATAGASLYSLLLLAMARRAPRLSSQDEAATVAPSKLVALVPAHDEEEMIAATLRSLAVVDYPTDAWRVLVVADNCTDRTAAVARAEGAEVIERIDPERRGKGYALERGFAALLEGEDRPDGILVVDADCAVTRTIAREIDRHLRNGAVAVQAENIVANPCESTYSALRYAAFTAINGIRPRGRDALGLSAGLLGTGMAFSSDLIARRPWEAYGLAEDVEYHLGMVEDGERVVFAAGAGVESPMPTSFDAAATQQARWGGGRQQLARTWVPRLIAAAARRREATPVVAAVDLVMPPLSLLVAGTAGVALVAAALRARAAAFLAAMGVVGQIVYLVGSLRLARAPNCVYRALAAVPILVAWQLRLTTRNSSNQAPGAWIRTARERPQAPV